MLSMNHRDHQLRPPRSWALLMLAGAVGLASCAADSVPDALQSPEATIHSGAVVAPEVPQLLRHAPDAPSLQATTVTFVAVPGAPQAVDIPYAAEPGWEGGDVFLRLELEAESLLAHPGGAPVEPGDEVTISIEVDPDPASGSRGRLCAKFSPAGLQFDPDHPAKLTLSFAHADPDVDGDGQADLEWERARISMWRQGASDEPWERVNGATQTIDRDVEAELHSFSRYALSI
jgi:hypothetical protein